MLRDISVLIYVVALFAVLRVEVVICAFTGFT